MSINNHPGPSMGDADPPSNRAAKAALSPAIPNFMATFEVGDDGVESYTLKGDNSYKYTFDPASETYAVYDMAGKLLKEARPGDAAYAKFEAHKAGRDPSAEPDDRDSYRPTDTADVDTNPESANPAEDLQSANPSEDPASANVDPRRSPNSDTPTSDDPPDLRSDPLDAREREKRDAALAGGDDSPSHPLFRRKGFDPKRIRNQAARNALAASDAPGI